MTTERLFEFLVLSQTLSYSKAAKKLFMTQSALSRHIIEMEKELGVQVLERSTHGVRLTQSGVILAQRSPDLIRKCEAAVAHLRVSDLESGGSVRIACLESVAYHQFMVFITNFCAKHGNIDVSVDVINDNERLAVLKRYDFTFSAFELQGLTDEISSAVAYSTPGVLSVLAEHRFVGKQQIGLDELSGENLIVPYADEVFCSYALNRQLTEKLTGYHINIIKVPTVESALMMVALGKGVAIIPQGISQNSVSNVWTIDISTPGCVFDTYVYWNRSKKNPAAKLLASGLNAFTNVEE